MSEPADRPDEKFTYRDQCNPGSSPWNTAATRAGERWAFVRALSLLTDKEENDG